MASSPFSFAAGLLVFGAQPVALVLETSCAVCECNSPLLQAPDEFGLDASTTELLCRLPYLSATDMAVRLAWRVRVREDPERQVLCERVL